MNPLAASRFLLLAALLPAPACAGRAQSAAAPSPSAPLAIAIPGGEAGIGFDDLRFAPSLRRILAPAGRTGALALIDPATRRVTTLGGFTAGAAYTGGHGQGGTSADEGAGLLFASDRNTRRVNILDPVKGTFLAYAGLAAGPDYVRYVEPTGEVWVTEPGKEMIEIFKLHAAPPQSLTLTGTIAVPGGPESLVIDGKNGRAYTHLWDGKTAVIDMRLRKIIALWRNGCTGSRGIALDEARHFLFAGCDEGGVTALDTAHDGRLLSRIATGAGVDIIDYNPALAHLYAPAAESGTLEILGVSAAGSLKRLASWPAATGAHCAATDAAGNIFACDPDHGRLLAYRDTFPPDGN